MMTKANICSICVHRDNDKCYYESGHCWNYDKEDDLGFEEIQDRGEDNE